MEEADLLKERLQAITDKRKIQEIIAKKRRQIEEEKLKLQYIKKKALREQWLMDGLSQQSEEEQEAMRLQAQDEQQQSDQLQSNILSIEKEIEALEMQELNISANEEVVLKRLKEVERTTDDIIKELKAEFQADVTLDVCLPNPDIPSLISLTPTKISPIREPASQEPKKATFAIEISVEHDKRTGTSQVVSTAAIPPETIEDRGLKVYDDGCKTVYALHPHGGKMHNGAVGEMTPTQVEELLHQATDKNLPTEVQYHQPVYSASYTGGSRPSTPRTPNKTPSPSPYQRSVSSRNEAQTHRGESQCSQDLERWKTSSKTPSPSLIQQDSILERPREETKLHYCYIPGQPKGDSDPITQPNTTAKTSRALPGGMNDASSPNPAALISVKARSEGMLATVQPLYSSVDGSIASRKSEDDAEALIETLYDPNRRSPFYADSIASLNLVNTLPEELESKPITMIFMGYENAEDDDEEDIQAELVTIGNSDDDDYDDDIQHGNNKCDGEEILSYHPQGCRSKVFQPKMGQAKVSRCRDIIEDTYTDWDDLGLHKPTFIHKSGQPSPYQQGQRSNESGKAQMKLCSTGR